MYAFRIVFLLLALISTAYASLQTEELRWRSVYKLEKKVSKKAQYFTLWMYDKEFKGLKDCVIFKDNSLYIQELGRRQKCDKGLYLSKKKAEVFNFDIELDKKTKTLLISMDKKDLKLPLMNLKGAQISFAKASENSYLHSQGTLCFDVADDCSVKKDLNCKLCEKGVFEVIASSCQSKRRLYCGRPSCGKKGEPACIRGFKASNYKGPYCINDSPIAYCKDRSRVICVEKELRCN